MVNITFCRDINGFLPKPSALGTIKSNSAIENKLNACIRKTKGKNHLKTVTYDTQTVRPKNK